MIVGTYGNLEPYTFHDENFYCVENLENDYLDIFRINIEKREKIKLTENPERKSFYDLQVVKD